MKKQEMTLAERICSRTIVWTWPFYAVGALYIVGPVLGWILAFLAFIGLYMGQRAPAQLRPHQIPATVWVWLICMALMLVVLWVGHWNFNLGVVKTIKSSVGWAKGWALIALFIFVGAVLPIRPKAIIRAQCVLGLHCLILLPIFVAAPMAGLPDKIFVSPLKMVGGPGPEYFTVYLYTIDPSNGAARWQFFAPWSPFAGLLGVIMFLCGLEEKQPFWKSCGILAGLAMVIMTKSRMSLLGVVVCSGGAWIAPWLLRPLVWYLGATATAALIAVSDWLVQSAGDAVYAFKQSRAASTRVRETLQRIAEERWSGEAVWFGHGSVEPGSHVTEYMPIGSHHTWFGLLFVKGLVGMLLFALPMILTLAVLLRFATQSTRGRLPLGLLLAVLFFSFGENMEVQAYMVWPALVLIGVGLREARLLEKTKEAKALGKAVIQLS